MKLHRRDFPLLLTLAAAAAMPALGQTVAPVVRSAPSGTQTVASIPDFSGIWAHPYLPGFEPPATGPGPVLNRSRSPNGRANFNKLVEAAVGLVPDAKVLEFGKDRSSGGQQLAQLAPVHAHEGDGPIPAECGGMTKRCLQEGRQGLARHLAGPHGEFTMVRARGPIGEETFASIRRPAGWNGVASLRPTPGLVSRSGMWDGYPSPTAQMGPMARNVKDLALLLDTMVGYDPEDPVTALGIGMVDGSYTRFLDKDGLKGARIGILREPIGVQSEPESQDFRKVDAVFEQNVSELKAAGTALVGSVAFVSTAFAKHNHNNGPQLVGNKLNTNGKHEIHKVGEHTVSVQIENKKVAGVSVTHRTKGNVAVRKYKTSKKMAQGNEIDAPAETNGSLVQPAAYQIAQSAIAYIGYSFFDGVDEHIYWFPAEMVVDPFTGAVEYVPLA